MQSFSIAPAATKFIWFLPVVLALVLVPIIGLGVSLLGGNRAQFEVSPAGLQLRGDWYGRVIPAKQLRTDRATRIDFGITPDLMPERRTMGTGLPGYQAGWFQLRNGERALLYLTDRSRAVYVPTTAGYSVILSPADPDAFLSALRSVGR